MQGALPYQASFSVPRAREKVADFTFGGAEMSYCFFLFRR
jgi:hypothetical protein